MTGIPKEAIERIGGGAAPRAAVTSTPSNPDPLLVEWLTGRRPGEDGPVVNERTAPTYAAFLACTKLIAETIASLPLKVYKRREGAEGGQDEAPERPEYRLLQHEFNPNTSAMTGRVTGNAHLVTWGNSYCQVVRNRAPTRDVLRLQPLGPDRVCPRLDGRGALVYDVYTDDRVEPVELRRDEVLHVPGLSFDGLVGLSPVRLMKTTLRAGMAQDREAERFATRGIRPPGGIKFPSGQRFATPEEGRTFRDKFRLMHATEDGSLNVVVLEDGAEWFEVGVDPEKAQLLESRKLSALEVCGIFHVPPHMVGLVEKTTAWGTGIEEMTVGFVVYCLLPVIRKIEQEYNRKLFVGAGAPEFFCEHSLAGLLRGDTLKQAQALKIYLELGLLTVNEARRLLGHNPTRGGNVRYFPLNFGRVDAETGEDIPPPAPARPAGEALPPAREPAALPPAPDQSGLAAAARRAVVAAVGRCLRREAALAAAAARKPAGFVSWVDEFYAAHGPTVADYVRAPVEVWAAAFGADPWGGPDRYVERHLAASKEALLAAAEVPADRLAASVEAATARWTSERLAELAADLQPAGAA